MGNCEARCLSAACAQRAEFEYGFVHQAGLDVQADRVQIPAGAPARKEQPYHDVNRGITNPFKDRGNSPPTELGCPGGPQ